MAESHPLTGKIAALPPSAYNVAFPPGTDCYAGLPLWSLEPDECRWPIASGVDGESRFCAEPTSLNPKSGAARCYCEAHATIAYSRPTAVRRTLADKTVNRWQEPIRTIDDPS